MNLKVCGNADRENLSQLLALQPDYAGFVFYPPSKRYVGDDQALREYIARLRSVLKVGVFVNADKDEILVRVDAYQLDLVQLHGDESPSFCRQISARLPVIKAFGISEGFDFDSLRAYTDCCDYFLFDTATPDYGGSGTAFDWTLLNQYRLNTPFFLSGGVGVDQAPAIKAIAHPALVGIDVNSRFEVAPGIKDIQKLKTLFHEIRN